MNLMKRIRHILHVVKCKMLYENRVTPFLYKLGCKLRLFKPCIIVYVDGGICSQMHQYLLGRYYAERGYRVAYDIGWYDRNGKDNDGIHSRIFEFPELWPDLPLEIASRKQVAFIPGFSPSPVTACISLCPSLLRSIFTGTISLMTKSLTGPCTDAISPFRERRPWTNCP